MAEQGGRANYFHVVPKSSPALDENWFYVGADDGTSRALDQASGIERWRIRIDDPRRKGIFSSPAETARRRPTRPTPINRDLRTTSCTRLPVRGQPSACRVPARLVGFPFRGLRRLPTLGMVQRNP